MIKRISKEIFVDFIEDYKDEILLYFEENIFNENDDYIFYAYIEEGEVIGACSITTYINEIEINNCFVHPDRRKEGILTNLIEYGKNIAELMQMPLVATTYLETSYSIFKKAGFIENGKAMQKMIFNNIE